MKKTCHDDGWPMEDKNPMEDKYAQINSIDSYIFNEIISQKNAAAQLMVIDSALIGIYVAFMMNSQSLEALRHLVSHFGYPFFRNSPNSGFFLFLIPTLFLLLSMLFCVFILKPQVKDIHERIDKYVCV